ncbi:putative tricarboxylic transport membrane protein [Ancylobacter sp. 3268]|uniref:tripartite tricarboxylate transporter TctB family protein n=1 Tax=Ancylobacter sp. 3268 TaxID=2817752 RepID=UPI00285A43BD|nr:tripartite tricarboxylate transporter TctB family protein [Ancylobacter sp. 3268]MDR6953242.1 putative tricarboxylic transport membrane protein [Ancylobacter sp. 3268]
MKIHDSITGGIFALFGVFMLVYAAGLHGARHLAYGPGFFPSLIGGGLVLIGGAVAWNGLRAGRREPLAELPAVSGKGAWLRFAAIPSAILFYVLAADTLGFVLAAAVILAALFTLAGLKLRHGAPVALAVSVLFTVFFASLLHMPLPWGPLRDVSGWLIW